MRVPQIETGAEPEGYNLSHTFSLKKYKDTFNSF